MPIAPSCCEKIAALVARRWLPAVVLNRISVFMPLHVQVAVLPRVGTAGPPVQPCALSSAMAFFGAKFHFVYHGFAFGPMFHIGLFSGFMPGAIWP